MPDLAIVNGAISPLEAAVIPATDLAFLRGCGAFETWRSYGGEPHALGLHCQRLWSSAAIFGIEPFVSERELRQWLRQAREQHGYTEVKVNAVCSPGDHHEGVFGARNPRLVLIIRELHEPPSSWYETGVDIITWLGERTFPEHKTVNYLCGVPALAKAQASGAHEAIYLDAEGRLSEGVTSNIHARFGMTVRSPLHQCLDGITRRGIASIAQEMGLTWDEQGALRPGDLLAADEVWISSAIRELVPVVRIDGQQIADGRPGPFCQRLRQRYRSQCLDDALAEASACV
ncbi:MAG: hypothetical protein EA402_14635 [Planctomycetota bacterium]|nr:MAG: hypothetical protein EA402_14635 [Planctomycetota bacterium]